GRRRGFVDPSAIVVAVDRNGGEIDDRLQSRRCHDRVAQTRQHRIRTASPVRGNGDQQHGCIRYGGGKLRRGNSGEDQHLNRAITRPRRTAHSGIFRRARRAHDTIESLAVERRVVAGRGAETPAKKRGHPLRDSLSPPPAGGAPLPPPPPPPAPSSPPPPPPPP